MGFCSNEIEFYELNLIQYSIHDKPKGWSSWEFEQNSNLSGSIKLLCSIAEYFPFLWFLLVQIYKQWGGVPKQFLCVVK